MELLSQRSMLSSDEETKGFDLSAGQQWIYPENFPLREYQFCMVKSALYHNTLICLPTGLGKTFIAAVVMYNFWRWYPQGKIVFLAPTKPLVAQQINACQDIMGIPREDTVELTGTVIQKKRELAWAKENRARVIFATPQVFQKDLEKNIIPSQLVKCVVIDEAHRASGKHAYCESIRLLSEQSKYFRVVGLSATPGAKLEAVQEVVRNLHITHLELRDDTSPDIKPYINERKVDIIMVALGSDLEAYKDRYVSIMDCHVRILVNYNILRGNTGSISKGRIFMLNNEWHSRPNKGANAGIIEKTLRILMTMYHAYDLMIRHGLRAFSNFYKKHDDKYWLKDEPALGELLEEIGYYLGPLPELGPMYDDSLPVIPEETRFGHNKFLKLKEILSQHFESFENKNEDTRAIVFVEFRDIVNEVYVLLLQLMPLIRPQKFVGQAGQKQKQQKKALEDFRNNKVNVLISTSVGEEGLDVGEVDLIVCFDISQQSPIRLVQRMGRTGRKRDGHIIVLVTDGKELQTLKSAMARRDSLNSKVMQSSAIINALYDESPRMVPKECNPECFKRCITVQPAIAGPSKPKRKTKEPKKPRKPAESKGKNAKKPGPSTVGAESSLMKFLQKAKDPEVVVLDDEDSVSQHTFETHSRRMDQLSSQVNYVKPKSDNVKLLTSDDAAVEFLTLCTMKKSNRRNSLVEEIAENPYFPNCAKKMYTEFDFDFDIPNIRTLDCLKDLSMCEDEPQPQEDFDNDSEEDNNCMSQRLSNCGEYFIEDVPDAFGNSRFEDLLDDSTNSDTDRPKPENYDEYPETENVDWSENFNACDVIDFPDKWSDESRTSNGNNRSVKNLESTNDKSAKNADESTKFGHFEDLLSDNSSASLVGNEFTTNDCLQSNVSKKSETKLNSCMNDELIADSRAQMDVDTLSISKIGAFESLLDEESPNDWADDQSRDGTTLKPGDNERSKISAKICMNDGLTANSRSGMDADTLPVSQIGAFEDLLDEESPNDWADDQSQDGTTLKSGDNERSKVSAKTCMNDGLTANSRSGMDADTLPVSQIGAFESLLDEESQTEWANDQSRDGTTLKPGDNERSKISAKICMNDGLTANSRSGMDADTLPVSQIGAFESLLDEETQTEWANDQSRDGTTLKPGDNERSKVSAKICMNDGLTADSRSGMDADTLPVSQIGAFESLLDEESPTDWPNDQSRDGTTLKSGDNEISKGSGQIGAFEDMLDSSSSGSETQDLDITFFAMKENPKILEKSKKIEECQVDDDVIIISDKEDEEVVIDCKSKEARKQRSSRNSIEKLSHDREEIDYPESMDMLEDYNNQNLAAPNGEKDVSQIHRRSRNSPEKLSHDREEIDDPESVDMLEGYDIPNLPVPDSKKDVSQIQKSSRNSLEKLSHDREEIDYPESIDILEGYDLPNLPVPDSKKDVSRIQKSRRNSTEKLSHDREEIDDPESIDMLEGYDLPNLPVPNSKKDVSQIQKSSRNSPRKLSHDREEIDDPESIDILEGYDLPNLPVPKSKKDVSQIQKSSRNSPRKLSHDREEIDYPESIDILEGYDLPNLPVPNNKKNVPQIQKSIRNSPGKLSHDREEIDDPESMDILEGYDPQDLAVQNGKKDVAQIQKSSRNSPRKLSHDRQEIDYPESIDISEGYDPQNLAVQNGKKDVSQIRRSSKNSTLSHDHEEIDYPESIDVLGDYDPQNLAVPNGKKDFSRETNKNSTLPHQHNVIECPESGPDVEKDNPQNQKDNENSKLPIHHDETLSTPINGMKTVGPRANDLEEGQRRTSNTVSRVDFSSSRNSPLVTSASTSNTLTALNNEMEDRNDSEDDMFAFDELLVDSDLENALMEIERSAEDPANVKETGGNSVKCEDIEVSGGSSSKENSVEVSCDREYSKGKIKTNYPACLNKPNEKLFSDSTDKNDRLARNKSFRAEINLNEWNGKTVTIHDDVNSKNSKSPNKSFTVEVNRKTDNFKNTVVKVQKTEEIKLSKNLKVGDILDKIEPSKSTKTPIKGSNLDLMVEEFDWDSNDFGAFSNAPSTSNRPKPSVDNFQPVKKFSVKIAEAPKARNSDKNPGTSGWITTKQSKSGLSLSTKLSRNFSKPSNLPKKVITAKSDSDSESEFMLPPRLSEVRRNSNYFAKPKSIHRPDENPKSPVAKSSSEKSSKFAPLRQNSVNKIADLSNRFAAPKKYTEKMPTTNGTETANGKRKLASLNSGENKKRKKLSERQRARARNEYIDDEAVVSSDCDHSSGSTGTDEDLEDFVSYTQNVNDDVDMQAHYLQTVRSPCRRGAFLFKKPTSPRPDVEIYSQPMLNETNAYVNDSFCVADDEDVFEELSSGGEITTIEQFESTRKGKKRRRTDTADSGNRRKRKIQVLGSDETSSEDEMEKLRRQICDESILLKK